MDFKPILQMVVKGTRIKIILNDGMEVSGQYELETTDDRVCIFTDDNDEYEYFDIEKIIQVTLTKD